ncbi:DUF262 domain-containing protein [Neobacillus drentensis]|uniref:DUF262 domain-containing protein n=1 Tax=Neobacillus drentensis TaxID=220684 RepID=UPI002FFF38F8
MDYLEESYEEDLEEIEEDIEAVDLEKKYDRAQKELVTQTVDFNVRNLADMVTNKQIDTSPKYQRRLRWDNVRKSKLIESILMNVPIPPLFFAEEKYGKYAVIDGQQRLRALSEFFTNMLELDGLEVFKELNGKRFAEIPIELQSILNMRPTLRCIIILRQSDPQIKFEVFERLNTGGVHLNPQEIRNSAYRGPLNDLIIDLSESTMFREMLKIKSPNKSKIVQQMRDCELILRFFAIKDSWENFRGRHKDLLNNFMMENQELDDEALETLKLNFTNTLELVRVCFGENAFRRYNPGQENWATQVLASLFDAQMIACYELNIKKEVLLKKQENIIEAFKNVFSDDEFLYSIGSGTNQKSKIVYRVNKIKELIINEVQ